MKISKHGLPALLLLAGMGLAPTASAALVSKLGGQVVFDTTRNITWLADANLAASNTFGVGGINASGAMNWNTAQSWIAGMNAANYLGFNNWRLPTSLNLDGTGPCGPAFNCTDSELGNMFYGGINNGLGGTAVQSITDPSFHNANYNLFNNIQSFVYWSGTEYAPDPNFVWHFGYNIGNQNSLAHKSLDYYAWAVRSGDVSAVPLPAAAWLFCSALTALAALGGWNRRRG